MRLTSVRILYLDVRSLWMGANARVVCSVTVGGSGSTRNGIKTNDYGKDGSSFVVK